MDISTTAWIAGFAAALLYLILGWPIAMLLSHMRLAFVSFQMKLLAAVAIGAVCAPLAEHFTPQLLDKTQIAISKSPQATQVYNSVAGYLK